MSTAASLHDPQIQALAKASRRAAMLSLSGIVIVVASVVYSAYRLYELNTQLATLQDKKLTLEGEVKDAETKLGSLQSNIQGLSYTKVTAQNQVYQLQATAKARPGIINPNGNGVYDFSIFVNASDDVLNNIEKVTYDFNHPTFKKPHQESADSEDKFAVRYVGWGCLTNVAVTVYLKDGTKQSIPFDMCQSLGGDWS
jgi:hypothetical protein